MLLRRVREIANSFKPYTYTFLYSNGMQLTRYHNALNKCTTMIIWLSRWIQIALD